MVIALDIDNCLFPLTEQVLRLYNSRTDKNIQMSDLTTYNFYECLAKEDADGICSLFKEKALWDSLVPIPGSQEAIEFLDKSGHTILLVTATDPINFPWKCELIRKYYPLISTDNIVRIMDKSYVKCDIIIDDDLKQLKGNFCERICYSYPWNQNDGADFVYDIYRCNSWNEILTAVKDIEGKLEE